MSYLEDLTLRLAEGLGKLPEDKLDSHARFIASAQQPDGGFSGREGSGDLYYTGFALRGLALTGQLHGPVADRVGGFLRHHLNSQAPIVDFLSLIYGARLLDATAGIDIFEDCQPQWRENVIAMLEQYRRDDGGYAKSPEGARSSTYHTFLMLLCLELLDAVPTAPEAIVRFLKSQQRDGGGFVEISAMRRSGTNPTAAAIGALRVLNALDEETQQQTADFLADMQTDEGGLRANTRIPIADLLSTFTGLLTLQDLNAADEIETDLTRRFALALEDPAGGFHGAAWDEGKDVEYTFYGLGTLALLGPA